jgi:hypothetical protein
VVGGTPEAAQPVCIPPGRPHTFWNATNTTELDMGAKGTQPGPANCSCAMSEIRPQCAS